MVNGVQWTNRYLPLTVVVAECRRSRGLVPNWYCLVMDLAKAADRWHLSIVARRWRSWRLSFSVF